MKTRNGFVSNSSSSSFILGFNKDPRDIKNLAEEMGECTAETYTSVLPKEEVIQRTHKAIIGTSDEKIQKTYKYEEEFDGYFEDLWWDMEQDDKRLKEILKPCSVWLVNEDNTPISYEVYKEDMEYKIKREQEQGCKNPYYKLISEDDFNYAQKKYMECIEKTKKDFDAFFDKYNHVYILEWDDDSYGYPLESGRAYKNVPHIKISHH